MESFNVRPEDVKRFVSDSLVKVGATVGNAKTVADVLTAADLRGHYSHGLNRLDKYVNEIEKGFCNGQVSPVIIKETPSTAFVDGKDGLGMVVSKFCMDLAIAKAKQTGIAWVNCTASNHYGMAAWYVMRAAEEGLIGMNMTNSSPLQVPTRAKKIALGSNPISFAAPAKNGEVFVVDLATCNVAIGKVELNLRKGIDIPIGWGVDEDGKDTSDPSKVLNGGGLMPMGGTEETGGYKGYGLATMVDVLCGVLGGGPFGQHIKPWVEGVGKASLGHSFMALNPDCFAPGFQDRLSVMMEELRNLKPVDPSRPMMIAGDPELKFSKETEIKGYYSYPPKLIADLNEMAARIQVEPIRIIKKE